MLCPSAKKVLKFHDEIEIEKKSLKFYLNKRKIVSNLNILTVSTSEIIECSPTVIKKYGSYICFFFCPRKHRKGFLQVKEKNEKPFCASNFVDK